MTIKHGTKRKSLKHYGVDKLRSDRELHVVDTTIMIELAEINENKAQFDYKNETDEEMKASLKEDAYLQRLIQIRESRILGVKDFKSERLEEVVGQSYEELFIPEFEDFKMQ